jgi:acyl carrier protein
MREKLRTYITEEIIGDPNYDLSDDEELLSSGLVDSFSLVDMAMWIEDEFDITIDNSELNQENFNTLDELVAYLEEQQ